MPVLSYNATTGTYTVGEVPMISPPHPMLMEPDAPTIQSTLDGSPFAPSVLAEDSHEYFDLKADSPYMLLVDMVNEKRCNPLPVNHEEMNMHDRLYFLRSDIPAITHVDYTARIQTVHRETNPRYWQLINTFKEQTGYGLLVNTSFNVRGEPIICTPDDEYRCFMRTEMDYLVVANQLFSKAEQPEWHEGVKWQDQYELD